MKFFNTAGPVRPEDHYFVGQRYDRQELDNLIAMKKYFILHAPRQTGKTSLIMNYVKKLNAEENYSALYVNVEAAQAARSDVRQGMEYIISQFQRELYDKEQYKDIYTKWFQQHLKSGQVLLNSFSDLLTLISVTEKKPFVLFIDEIDALVGDTLISVLRQLRAGYASRPERFPQSVCLFGVRDIRDYRIWSDKDQQIVLGGGGSAFNIKAESLRLQDFTKEQVFDLLLQHTQETSQQFTPSAMEHVFHLTNGQPWLVNALAYEVCFRKHKDRTKIIDTPQIEDAKEELIRRRDTHLDVLIDRLKEARVRQIMDQIFKGENDTPQFQTDDVQYLVDLGLLKENGYKIANPIYQEILPRELTYTSQIGIHHKAPMYIDAREQMDIKKLLAAFQEFYRENAEQWLANFDYKESSPHLLMMAFLQRVINGGGSVHREYGLGRKRVDLLVKFKDQKFVIELKILKDKSTLAEGLKQTREYLDIAGTAEGHLIIFDRDMKKNWGDKIYRKEEIMEGKKIMIWGV